MKSQLLRIFNYHQQLILYICLIFLLFFLRLCYLQLYKSTELFARSEKNYTHIHYEPAMRGNITDVHGKLLATNKPVLHICWHGTGNKQITQDQLQIINDIFNSCNICQSRHEILLKHISHAEKYRKEYHISSNLTHRQLSKIVEKHPNNQNICIEKSFKRFYPQRHIACHIIGYIQNIDTHTSGKLGLEKCLEQQLQGNDGAYIQITNSFGSNITKHEISPAQPGTNIVSTIDLFLQHITEEIFPHNYQGACIIMDPLDGAIKTLVSRPNFDPNMFQASISQLQWLNIQKNMPFLNRAFNACYPPASIFKLVTTAAALENGYINQDDITYCSGKVTLADKTYHCAKRSGHGFQNVCQSLATSCNILFYMIGKKIPIDDLAEYANHFGLGRKTNTLFAEQVGLIPNKHWKVNNKQEAWWKGETLHTCIGQGYLLVTPIQVCRMIGGIFTGYLVKPRLLIQEPIYKEPLYLSGHTTSFLQKSMKSVIQQGTAKKLNTITDLKVYAKTGTAETCSSSTGTLKPHAWFVAYIEHPHKSPIIFVLLIEHAGSSKVATGIAKKFLMRYRKI